MEYAPHGIPGSRSEEDCQSAEDRLPDEGQSAARRAEDARTVGRKRTSTGRFEARARAVRSTSCTTARRTPTAISTSGTRSTRSLKDFIVKSKTMAGFDSPYVPGWDCHGLPIEIKVDSELGSKKAQMSAAEIRARVPQVRGEIRRPAARGFHPPRRLRRVGRPVPHDGRRHIRRSSRAPSSISSTRATSTRD